MYVIKNVSEDGLLYRNVIRRMLILATVIALHPDDKAKFMLPITPVKTSPFSQSARGPRDCYW